MFDQAALPASSAAATMIPIVPLPEETIEISMRVAESKQHIDINFMMYIRYSVLMRV